MSLVLAQDGPGVSGREGPEHRRRIHVLHTRMPNTVTALRGVSALRGGAVTILAPVPVPYRLPLTEPPVSLDFTQKVLLAQAKRLTVDTTIELLLCRDAWAALRQTLTPGSVVVLGDNPHWWQRHPERKLARLLRTDGHKVFLVDPKDL